MPLRTPYSSSTMRMLPSAMVVSSPGRASDRGRLAGRCPAPASSSMTASTCLPVTGLSRNRASRDHSRSPPASPSKRVPVSAATPLSMTSGMWPSRSSLPIRYPSRKPSSTCSIIRSRKMIVGVSVSSSASAASGDSAVSTR